jgi:crotonobetainyl-CoA:carnitine CoA-transferase CaiB-like acyl-CoA transferase
VLDTEGVMNDTHNNVRNIFHEIEQPGAGKIRLPKAPFRFSEAAVEVSGRAPLLGEDNEMVLAEILHYSKERIEWLASTGVLQRGPKVDDTQSNKELR